MKIITISADRKTVNFTGTDFPGSCIIRTRRLHTPSDVFYSTNADGSKGQPAMPNQFPRGTWNVIRTHRPDNPDGDLGPIVVNSDAHQPLEIWALDAGGGYDHPTGKYVEDYGYEIHYDGLASDGGYSVGCQHITSKDDMLVLGGEVEPFLAAGEKIQVNAL